MRNQQPEAAGNRYQFRLHPAATTIDEEQQQQLGHNHQLQQKNLCSSSSSNNNINIKSNDTSNKCVKAQMSASLAGGAGALKEASAALLQRKQFTPTSDASNASFSSASVAGSIQDDMSDRCSLTQAGLEEYNIRSSSYYDQPALFHHQKQSSYAQSEGYHSYVSSSDSSSATPFLDRLRQESEMLSRQSHHWSQNDLSSVSCASVAPSPTPLLLTMNGRDLGGGSASSPSGDNSSDAHHQQQQQQHNNSSESTSSTETLKWLGSMSDVSEASHATGYSAISESVSSSQLIVHSSRVLTPKRHHSESVLYLNNELQHATQPPAALASPLSDEQRAHHSLSLSLKQGHFPAADERAPPGHAASVRISPNHRHSPSYPPTHSAHSHALHAYSAKKDSNVVGLPPSPLAMAITDLPQQQQQQQQQQQHKSSISVTIASSEDSPSEAASGGFAAASSPSATSPLSVVTAGAGGASPTSGAPSSSSSSSSASSTSPRSGLSTASCRSNHRLFPVSTYTEPVHSNTSQYVQHPRPQFSAGLPKPAPKQKFASPQQPQQLPQTPPQPSWQSVAELIHDFERSADHGPPAQAPTPAPGQPSAMLAPGQQQQQKYSFIEPSKTHRVSNPALKAFQKNAVQSYFERQQQQQQQQQQQHSKELQQQQQRLYQQQQSLRPHSFQPPAAAKEPQPQPQPQLLRNSLPNSYGGGAATSPTGPGYQEAGHKPPSPAPPPPPPRSRSLMPTLLRRSSSASDYAEFREQCARASQEKLQAQSVKNISSSEKSSFNDCGMPPPPPPPRGRASLPVRRTSSASEYAAMRDKVLQQQAAALAQHQHQQQQQQRQRASQPFYSPAPPPEQGWAPERPPKNPSLRVPSPELPPPPSAEADASPSDEPLPPPPPEILHRPAQPFHEPGAPLTFSLGGEPLPPSLPKPPSPSRRNSFAGSSTRKPPPAFFGRSSSSSGAEQAGPVPPLVPKKPTSIELLQLSRPASSLAAQCNKAHKVLLNGGGGLPHPPQQPQQQLHQQQQHSPASSKLSANRKRPHNPAAMLHIPPILENPPPPLPNPNKFSPTSPPAAAPKSGPKPSPPPPLKPRMSTAGSQGPAASIGSKPRCNSKASYLPRQSLEKLNNADPDHGSYKLTLTSNEDLVGHAKPGYDILAHNGKLPSNLPDVLPLGAKLQPQPQPQPASPTAANGSPLRYSSNGNLSAASTPSPTQQPPATCYPSMYPAQHRYSTPAMTSSKNYFNNNSNNNSNNSQATNNYTRSQSYDVNSNPNTSASSASPTKFMSQSTIDLKRTHNLETTQEEAASTEGATVPASAQSETNLSSISHSAPAASPVSRTVSLDERGEAAEGRIVRAELVNTTLPASPSANANNNNKTVTRKDSLRENIEKITQLQSKLMSAHLADSGLLGGYSAKAAPSVQTSRAELELESKPCAPRSPPGDTAGDDADKERPDSSATAESCATPPALPKTPPPVAGSEDATASQISQMDSDTDGLKLMQRSELVLRVNPATVETASQTDALPEGDMGRLTESLPHAKDEALTRTTLQPRRRHPIELSCELMARELAELLPPDDKLVELLTPRTVRSPADYVANLYNPDVPLRPGKRDVGTSTLMRMRARDSAHGDGEKHGVTVELQYAEIEVSLANGSGPESCDMLKKKVDELIKQLNRKLKILNREQTTLGEEAAINDELGSGLVSKLADKVRPIEASKFRTYIDDVGHITSLLLSLSERLAKAENSLSAFAEDHAEKKVLESKRDRLLEQLEEAKRLKEDIDRRGSTVTGMLERNLTADEFADFDYFINMKAKLIADARDIADKIKCGEEQLCALSEALIQSDC